MGGGTSTAFPSVKLVPCFCLPSQPLVYRPRVRVLREVRKYASGPILCVAEGSPSHPIALLTVSTSPAQRMLQALQGWVQYGERQSWRHIPPLLETYTPAYQPWVLSPELH